MTTNDILAMVAAGKLSVEQAAALLPKPASGGALHLKVSEKGAVSLYGLQRMPVTLYAGQWERLLGHVEAIRAFLTEHASELSVKGGPKVSDTPAPAGKAYFVDCDGDVVCLAVKPPQGHGPFATQGEAKAAQARLDQLKRRVA